MKKFVLGGLSAVVMGLFCTGVQAATGQCKSTTSASRAGVAQTANEAKMQQAEKPLVGPEYYDSNDNPFHQD